MSASKFVKSIILTAKASESHNSIKFKSIAKWLKAGYEIKVQITGKADRHKAIEDIYSRMEGELKQGAKFIQKVVKADNIKVILRPTEEAANINVEKSSKKGVNVDEELEQLVSDQDIFSEDFEANLAKSIKDERNRVK